jgi:hypothetical protein
VESVELGARYQRGRIANPKLLHCIERVGEDDPLDDRVSV